MRLTFCYHRRFEGVLPPRRTVEAFFVLAPITVEIPDEDVHPQLALEQADQEFVGLSP